MKTISLSTRISPAEVKTIDAMAERAGLERSAFLKQLIRKGMDEVAFEQAASEYRLRRVSLSRAAELAGISVREFLLRMEDAALELNYDVEEFRKDIGVS